MAQVKKIQCPSCGASSVFKLNTEEYKCNYCQTNFVVDEGKINHQVLQTDVIKSGVNKMGCIVAGIAAFVFVMIGVGVFLGIKKSSSRSSKIAFSKIMDSWNAPNVSRYMAFVGSKGPIIWEIIEETSRKMDSSKHSIRIVDPYNNSIKVNRQYGETTTWRDNINFYEKLDYDFLLVNDTLYNGSNIGGIQAFDLYSGKQLLGNSFFEKKYPQLKTGIVKVRPQLYYSNFIISTNDGDDYYYYPERHLLRSKKEEDDAYKTDTITSQNFFFSEGKKANLYLAIKKENRSKTSTLSDYYIEGYQKKDNYYKNYFKKLEKIGDKIYPCAQRLISSKEAVVFAYLSDFSKKADLIIEKVDEHGKTVWRNSDKELLSFIKNFTSTNLYLKYSYNSAQIVVFSNSPYKCLGMNLNTGKTTFVHTQGYNIE
ncbi:MAG: hypothetical protein SFY56_03505 [Bacteroidota bacterium]|nr:hypothetical protein [Bacteroidota bacterium]